jgi:hypothetical protein
LHNRFATAPYSTDAVPFIRHARLLDKKGKLISFPF